MRGLTDKERDYLEGRDPGNIEGSVLQALIDRGLAHMELDLCPVCGDIHPRLFPTSTGIFVLKLDAMARLQ